MDGSNASPTEIGHVTERHIAKPSARRTGEVQCLGDMPWVAGRLPFKPDTAQYSRDMSKVNGGLQGMASRSMKSRFRPARNSEAAWMEMKGDRLRWYASSVSNLVARVQKFAGVPSN
jgi:hypothetical protein